MSRKVPKLVHILNQRLTVILGAFELGAYDMALTACAQTVVTLDEVVKELKEQVRIAATHDAAVAKKLLKKIG